MNTLANLMLNANGLAFDPDAGNSYTLNDTGLFLLRAFQSGETPDAVVDKLVNTYEVDRVEAERDVADFQVRLRSLGLM